MNAVVASSSAQATEAGLSVLEGGGNAFDAAVTTSAMLGVVEPMASGIGGDLCGLIWPAGKSYPLFLNGIGRTSFSLSGSRLQDLGSTTIGTRAEMAYAMTVPGTVGAWSDLLGAFGTIDMKAALRPAIELCDRGVVVPTHSSAYWKSHVGKLGRNDICSVSNAKPSDLESGRPIRRPDLGETLLRLSEVGPSDLYGDGPLALHLIQTVRKNGGCLTVEDLASHGSLWGKPLSTTFNDMTVYQAPPPTQGSLLLLAISALKRLRRGSTRSSGTRTADLAWSLLAAATRTEDVVVDRPDARDNASTLLDHPSWIDEMISSGTPSTSAISSDSDTSIVVAVDQWGNAVSMLTSLYLPFGSGICVDGSGMILHNRAASFSLDVNSRSALRPGAQPPHTLMPGLLALQAEPWGALGVIGGAFQPQGNLQILHFLFDLNMSPQEALDQPRFRLFTAVDGQPASVSIEDGFDKSQVDALSAMGLSVDFPTRAPPERFGNGQLALFDAIGDQLGGSDYRWDGSLGWT